jgi:hypothetical protein
VKNLFFSLNSDLESAHFALRKKEIETGYQLFIPVAQAIFAG